MWACTPSPPRCELPAPHDGPPFLWRVEGHATLWLYGTLHDAQASDVPAPAWRALDAAARFASELGDAEQDADAVDELAHLPPGKGLDQLLAADDWYDLRDALRGVVREADLVRMRPWVAVTQLTRHYAPPPQPTMDVALADHARDRRVSVDALETWRTQLGALAESITLADLVAAIHARREMQCDVTRMVALYKAGDVGAMERLLLVGNQQVLLVARNREWLPKLEAYLADRGAFVAVGLGHVLGNDGLAALLERAGYKVTRYK